MNELVLVVPSRAQPRSRRLGREYRSASGRGGIVSDRAQRMASKRITGVAVIMIFSRLLVLIADSAGLGMEEDGELNIFETNTVLAIDSYMV